MGSKYSSTEKLDNTLFFSEFRIKLNALKKRLPAQKLGLLYYIETPLLPWSVHCLSKFTWNSLQPYLKNSVIKDLIDTIYTTSNSFADIFLLFFDCSHLAMVLIEHQGMAHKYIADCVQKVHKKNSFPNLDNVAEDILRYAFVTGLKYSHRCDGKPPENVIDFPLRMFKMCDCNYSRPLYTIITSSRPDVVKLLLNCGARIPYEDVCDCALGLKHPLMTVLGFMKVRFCPIEPASIQLIYRERCIVCLRALLADISHTTKLWKPVSYVLEEISMDDVKTEQIPTLKHITRTQIRLCMKSNRLFCKPQVLEELGLSKSLTSYLNIEE